MRITGIQGRYAYFRPLIGSVVPVIYKEQSSLHDYSTPVLMPYLPKEVDGPLDRWWPTDQLELARNPHDPT